MIKIFTLLKNTFKQLLITLFIALFAFSNMSAVLIGYFFTGQGGIGKIPIAHAAGTKTKTIEFFVGQNQTSGIGVAAGTNWNSVFTIDLPDAIVSPTMIKSAWIDYTFQSALTGPPGIVTLGLTPSGFSETVFNSASYQSSGENYTILVRPNFTTAMQAAMQGPGTKNITFRANVAGVPRKMENAKMFITYDYDDTAATQISTIKYRIGQSAGNVAVGATGVTFTSPTMAVTEDSPVVVSAWSEIRGQIPATGTTDSTFAVNYDADAASAYYLDNSGGTNSQAIYILHPKNSLTLNVAHNLKIAATVGYQMNLVSAEQVITYKFNYTNSTTLMQTEEIMLESNGNKASAVPLDVTDTINIPEDTPSFKNIYMRGTAHAVTNDSLGLAAQLGASVPTPATSYTYTASNEIMNNFWILSSDINNLGSMVQGNNQLSATFTGTMTSRTAQLIITYSFAKNSATQSASAIFWAVQQSAYGTTGTPAVNITIAGTPLAGSFRSSTAASSVSGVTVDRLVNISISPTAPSAYNWDSTGEYLWVLFFDKNINNEITGNGTYTVNLGSTGSNVVAAVEQVSWRYTTPPPSITSYVNSTEGGLDYVVACTECGARIGGGAGFRQTVVVTGTNFNTVGVGNRSTGGNNIKVGTKQIADANVIVWTDTSITFLTDSAVVGDTDSDWGTNFGGASALTITVGGQTSTGLNFYVLPQITGVRACDKPGFPVGTYAREYDASDPLCPNGLTDGEVFLDGTRFGSASIGGDVQIIGISVITGSWSNTLIQAQVSPAIADSTYTGSLVMQQGSDSNNKTHTYTTTGFRVLPRITGFTPTSQSEGSAVTVDGNHFCQNAAVCGTGSPGTDSDLVNTPAFTTNDRVMFTSSIVANYWGASGWTNTAMSTQVPLGSATGNVVLKSNGYDSNGKLFTILSNTPSEPVGLDQFKDLGLTQSIGIGNTASATPIYLKQTMEVPGIFLGTLYPQFEYRSIGTSFLCTGTAACGSAVEGAGSAGSGPATGSISISPSDNTYHWQARTCHNKGGAHTTSCGGLGDYPSAWVSFGGNLETETDINIDTTPPIVSNISSGSPGTNSATITWDTSLELSTSRVEYNTSGTFIGGYDCSGTNECTILDPTLVTSHAVVFPNLNSGTIYYYRVRSKDNAGNETGILGATGSFQTQSVTQPAKTTQTSLFGEPTVIASATTTYFTILAPEVGQTIKSAYIEVLGIVSGSGTLALQANNLAAKIFTIPGSSLTNFRLLYKIADGSAPPTEATLNLNDSGLCTNANPMNPGVQCNKLVITPSTASIYITSARFIMTYGFNP
ncbi:MAG: fibronectin type III domain-containing protein [bacterium]|nr:fibronectin type III domain-containing protein [bacterium]